MSETDASGEFQQGERKPKDRDFLRTREGMFFCVTGYLHPPDRYTAYLKYSPDPSGKWYNGETAYRRELPDYQVSNVSKTIRYLEEHYPRYVHDCPVRDIRFSMVPREYVDRYYDPQDRLAKILAHPRDPLEDLVCGLVAEIAKCAGISLDALGVTGSILIGLHNPGFSDMDMLVYGLENARKVREMLREDGSPQIQRPDAQWIARWCRGVTNRFPLGLEEARHIAARRWNYRFYRQRYLSIHPTRTDREITEEYGHHIYRNRGSATIRCVVTEGKEALFHPAIYQVAQVQVLEGSREASAVGEIITYEGLYRDIVNPGQEIEARGKLESVDGDSGRLVIGTTELQGAGYIKPA